jgi:hypothetical protein
MSFPGQLGKQIINNILFLVPLFLITIGVAASGLFFIFFEILHGFFLLILVQIFGGIIHKICKNKIVTAILQAFILMFIVIPKGPVVSLFW